MQETSESTLNIEIVEPISAQETPSFPSTWSGSGTFYIPGIFGKEHPGFQFTNHYDVSSDNPEDWRWKHEIIDPSESPAPTFQQWVVQGFNVWLVQGENCISTTGDFPFPPNQYENLIYIGQEYIQTSLFSTDTVEAFSWVGQRINDGPHFSHHFTTSAPNLPLRQVLINHPSLGGATELKTWDPDSFTVGQVFEPAVFDIPLACQ